MNAVHAPPIGQFDNNGGAHALADGMSGMSLGPYDAHENSPELWGAEAVCSWLTRNGFGALVEGFMQNDIRGAQLFNLQPDDYYQLGVTQLGVRKRLEDAIAQLGPQSSNGSGPSYGNIENEISNTVGGQSQTYKLFVGQIPKSASFEEVKLMFEEFGTVSDCVILRNKYTGESKGCGFVKYNTKEEGDAAIKALHNNRAMAPSTALLQVQFAHGEQVEGGGVTEQYKLFVGQLPKETSEAEVSKLFGGFGELTEVCLLRHPDGNSKGCGFVKFSNRDAAVRAIAALNGQKPLEGGTAPLNIEFAETKRDKQLKRVGMLGGGLMGGMGAMGGVNGAGMYGGAGAGLFSPYNNLAGQRGVVGGAAFRGPLPPVGGMGPPGGGGGPGGGGFGQFPIGPGPAAFMGGGGGMFPGGGGMYGGAGGGFPIGEPSQSNLGFTGGAAPGVGRYPPIGAGKNYVQGPGGANIFVYNLPPEVQDGDLASLFFGFGQILSTRVYIDKATGRSKGFGFVSFFNSESAAAAVQAMNNYEWFGRKLKVQVKK